MDGRSERKAKEKTAIKNAKEGRRHVGETFIIIFVLNKRRSDALQASTVESNKPHMANLVVCGTACRGAACSDFFLPFRYA